MSKPTCAIERCGKPVKACGYCARHYYNFHKTGNPIPKREWPLEARLQDVGWTVRAGCWEWNGDRDSCGYGMFTAAYLGFKDAKAHRVMYQLHVGPLPGGLFVRHKCDNPPCVNPAHLIIGTVLENARDMVERRRHAAHNRTVCGKGHDLTLPGAVRRIGGWNRCVRCWRVSMGLSDEITSPGPWSKVSPEQRQEIRQRRAAGASQKELAAEYGISQPRVSEICAGLGRKPAAS